MGFELELQGRRGYNFRLKFGYCGSARAAGSGLMIFFYLTNKLELEMQSLGYKAPSSAATAKAAA